MRIETLMDTVAKRCAERPVVLVRGVDRRPRDAESAQVLLELDRARWQRWLDAGFIRWDLSGERPALIVHTQSKE